MQLHRSVNYNVLLPNGFESGNKRYPVIYMLHGIGGDEESWLKLGGFSDLVDSLTRTGLIDEYIYIMPDAGNSYYLNNYDGSNMYMDFFIKELVPVVDSLFPTMDLAENRALMGLSMGGFGAIILAVENPQYIGSVMAFSAAVRTDSMFIDIPQAKYENYFGTVFGPGLEGENRLTRHWKENSPYSLMDTLLAQELSQIQWYLDCGFSDPLLPASKAFHNLLLAYNIPHSYLERPGNHNWEYWHKSAIYGLIFFCQVQN